MFKQAKQYTYKQITVGQKAEFDFKVSAKVVADFIKLSGDANPLHLDSPYAEDSEFKRPLAHGMIAGALFSRFIGMELPGQYSVYLTQNIKFHQPMFYGQKIIVAGEVLQKSDAFKTITISTKVFNKDTGELLVDGQAVVRLLK